MNASRLCWLAAVLGMVAVASTAPSLGAGAPRAGCTGRVAVASDGAGRPLAPQPPGAPRACLVPTGYATVETHVSVTADGAVVQEPAVVTPGLLGTGFVPGAPGPHPWLPVSPAGLAVTHDQGRTWRLVKPGGTYWTGSDATLYADPVTGRLFEETLSPGVIPTGGEIGLEDQTPGGHATLLVSADDGQTWDSTALTGFLFQENARFASAPPAPGSATTAGGYPDVTYWCGNRTVGLMEPLILERECYRSLDGGGSWEMRSILFTNPLPRHPECGTNREDINSYDGNYPQGSSDGSLYLIVSCTPPTDPTGHMAHVYLARSSDEAATFPILRDARGPVTLPVLPDGDWPELRVARVGGENVLVLVQAVTGRSGPQLQLRTAAIPPIAGDRLAHPLAWSAPIVVSPAGLATIDQWAVAVRGGEVATSVLGTRSPGTYGGFVSVVRDVLAPPLVWSAEVNDPASPLLRSAPTDAKDDFIGIDIGPDGTPWASFFASCAAEGAPAQTDPACAGAYLGGQAINAQIQGGNDRGLVASVLFPR